VFNELVYYSPEVIEQIYKKKREEEEEGGGSEMITAEEQKARLQARQVAEARQMRRARQLDEEEAFAGFEEFFAEIAGPVGNVLYWADSMNVVNAIKAHIALPIVEELQPEYQELIAEVIEEAKAELADEALIDQTLLLKLAELEDEKNQLELEIQRVVDASKVATQQMVAEAEARIRDEYIAEVEPLQLELSRLKSVILSEQADIEGMRRAELDTAASMDHMEGLVNSYKAANEQLKIRESNAKQELETMQVEYREQVNQILETRVAPLKLRIRRLREEEAGYRTRIKKFEEELVPNYENRIAEIEEESRNRLAETLGLTTQLDKQRQEFEDRIVHYEKQIVEFKTHRDTRPPDLSNALLNIIKSVKYKSTIAYRQRTHFTEADWVNGYFATNHENVPSGTFTVKAVSYTLPRDPAVYIASLDSLESIIFLLSVIRRLVFDSMNSSVFITLILIESLPLQTPPVINAHTSRTVQCDTQALYTLQHHKLGLTKIDHYPRTASTLFYEFATYRIHGDIWIAPGELMFDSVYYTTGTNRLLHILPIDTAEKNLHVCGVAQGNTAHNTYKIKTRPYDSWDTNLSMIGSRVLTRQLIRRRDPLS
jgi:hypothetical protein